MSPLSPSDCININGGNNNNTIGAINCLNDYYMGKVGLGTPPQLFDIIFDTGSNILWIPTQGCSGCGTTFNPLASTTYNNQGNQFMNISYAGGTSVQGSYGSDVVTWSNTSIAVNTGILFVQNLSGFNSNANGIVGLGFTTQNNFFDSAWQAGQISSNVFAIDVGDELSPSNVHFGSFDVGETYFINEFGSGYWVKITKLSKSS